MIEIDLWNLLQEGDEEAFAQVYQQHVDALYSYGLNLGYSPDDVQDSIHDLFVNIYNKRGRYTAVKNVKVYLFIALKNTLLNRNPKMATVSLNPEEHDSGEASVEDYWIASEAEGDSRELLKRGIAQLSRRQKQVLYFRYYKTMSFKEIAEHLHINPQSAKNLAQSAVKKLRAFLMMILILAFLIG